MKPIAAWIAANALSFGVKFIVLGRVSHPTVVQVCLAVGFIAMFWFIDDRAGEPPQKEQ